jgi:hypothetical protein
MNPTVRDMPALELALLRRGVDELAAANQRCGRCHRTPLIGERTYSYAGGVTLCELCRVLQPERPLGSALVHGPEFGHTMRITDQRAVA